MLVYIKEGRLIDHVNADWLGKTAEIDGIKLFNPEAFYPGSTLSHVNDMSSVMYYGTGPDTCIRSIDDKVLHILNRIGWDCQTDYVPGKTPKYIDPNQEGKMDYSWWVFAVLGMIVGGFSVMACIVWRNPNFCCKEREAYSSSV